MANIKDKTVKENINTSVQYQKIILSNIKHDLTNPINAILGYSELIIDIVKDEDKNTLHRDIHAIHDSGNAILAHINEIFSIEPNTNDDHIGDIIVIAFFGSHYMAASYVDEPAGFYPPYIEKRVVYPELYKDEAYR